MNFNIGYNYTIYNINTIAHLVPYETYGRELKFIRCFTAADQSAHCYTFFTVQVKKVEYHADWLERINHHFFHRYASEKSEILC